MGVICDRAPQVRLFSQRVWGREANSTAWSWSRFWEVRMARIYMSGISLCATKQRYTLIYFDGGEDYFGATDKSPENLVDMFSGMRFQALAEGGNLPQSFSIFYVFKAASRKFCVCVRNICHENIDLNKNMRNCKRSSMQPLILIYSKFLLY